MLKRLIWYRSPKRQKRSHTSLGLKRLLSKSRHAHKKTPTLLADKTQCSLPCEKHHPVKHMCKSSNTTRFYKYSRNKIKSLYPCSFNPVQPVSKTPARHIHWWFSSNRNHSVSSIAIMQQTLIAVLFFGLVASVGALDLSHAAQPSQEIDPRIFNFINDFYAQVVYPPLNHIVTSTCSKHILEISPQRFTHFFVIFKTLLSWALKFWLASLKTVFPLLVVAPYILPKPNFAVSGADCGTTHWNHPLKTHWQVNI